MMLDVLTTTGTSSLLCCTITNRRMVWRFELKFVAPYTVRFRICDSACATTLASKQPHSSIAAVSSKPPANAETDCGVGSTWKRSLYFRAKSAGLQSIN